MPFLSRELPRYHRSSGGGIAERRGDRRVGEGTNQELYESRRTAGTWSSW